LLSVIASVSNVVNLAGIISLISKTIKFVVGIIMTVFAGITAFSGFSAVAGDNLAVQTAKFAVTNFVPVVGGCLSSALSGIKQSSVLLKNNLGFVGFLTLLSLSMMPLIKIMLSVFAFKLCASVVHLFNETRLVTMFDLVCEVLVTLGALVLFTGVVFLLIIGVISSVG
jgi:stage III sporulation protein AE